ncbi:MAG: hypothetical protein APF76_06600 [Desulfitibacter sp. BRH_c19]|nr:MAG: hypothetical protein APF76_06600 [Desulfitibacter sp. BRH_c19]
MYLNVIETIGIFFLLIFMGLAAKQLKLLNGNISPALTQLVMNLTLPLLLLTAFDFELELELIRQSLLVAFTSLVIIVVTALMFRQTVKYSNTVEKEKNLLEFLCLFGNTVFIGFPIVLVVFQETGLFLAIIFNLVNVVIVWTYGLWLMTPKDIKVTKLKFLKEPTVVAMFASIVMVALKLRIPSPFLETFETIGSMTFPLSFIIIGLTLEIDKIRFKELRKYFAITFIRLLFIPILLFVILKLASVSLMVAGVVIIMAGTPSGVLATIFAETYEGNVRMASEGVVFTTLVSIVTIPVLLFLIFKFY